MRDIKPVIDRLRQHYGDSRGQGSPYGSDRQICADVLAVCSEASRLREWRDSVSGAIKTSPDFEAGEWGGDKEGWGYHFELVCWMVREIARLRSLLPQTADGTLVEDCESVHCPQCGKPVQPFQGTRGVCKYATCFNCVDESRGGQHLNLHYSQCLPKHRVEVPA